MGQQHDPTDLAGQELARQELKGRERESEREERDDTKWLMSTRRGRRIVWRQLERAGVFRISFNTNAMQMAFNEGTRNEGLKLLVTVQAACPDQYTLMLQEQTSDDRNPADDSAQPKRR